MRIVMISDTHEQHESVRVPDGDLLIHAGDFTGRGEIKAIIKFSKWMGALPHEHKVVIPGNHDWLFEKDWSHAKMLMGSSGAVVLNQEEVRIGSVAGNRPAPPLTIWGEPRTPEFCDWAFSVPRVAMAGVWAQAPRKLDILISHGPPHGMCDTTSVGGEHVGGASLRRYVEEVQPRLVVCGHVHGGYGLGLIGRTLIVNASSCTEAYLPTNPPIVVDLA